MATIVKQTEKSGLISLDKIVREALMELGEGGLHRYEQHLAWAIRCHRIYHQQLAKMFKAVELPMTAWKAIEWPEDYVRFIRIGLRYNGRVIVFTADPDLPFVYDDEDADGFPDENVQTLEEVETIDTEAVTHFLNINSHGEDTGGIFGLGAKDNGVGYYRINKDRREIQLAPIINAQSIYLEYVSDAYDPTKATLVPTYMIEMFIAFMDWRRAKASRSAARSEVRELKRDYEIEFDKVRDIEDETTIADILEVVNDSYIASPHN